MTRTGMALGLATAAVLGAGLIGGSASLVAQEKPGRYVMQPTDGGVLRMDSDTGAVSLCARRGTEWACEPVGDSARNDRAEVDRLKAENADLKTQVKQLEDMLGVGKDQPQKRAEGPGIALPTEKEVDGALDYVERMYKKLRDRMKQLEGAGKTGEKGTPL